MIRTPPRLHLLLARDAPLIVILRRGPSRFCHLIAWNTETDAIEPGSWFHGRLYEHCADLSPDGRFLVYFALGPTREMWSWTAVSRPPMVRAEILWPQDSTWHGDGVWLSSNRLLLNLAEDTLPHPEYPSPAELGIRVERRAGGEADELFLEHLSRDGWRKAVRSKHVLRVSSLFALRLARDGWLPEPSQGSKRILDLEWSNRPTPQHPALRLSRAAHVPRYELDGYSILDDSVEWAGWDQQARLVVARKGVLARFTLADLERGDPSFRLDLCGLEPPEKRQRHFPAEEPQPAPPWMVNLFFGTGATGLYRCKLPGAAQPESEPGGAPIRSPADLARVMESLPTARAGEEARPQCYIVDPDGVFRVGCLTDDHVELAGGGPVRAAGEVVLEQGEGGAWSIAAINNRSHEYSPDAASWDAVDAALRTAGVNYPAGGFTAIYPVEGTEDEALES